MGLRKTAGCTSLSLRAKATRVNANFWPWESTRCVSSEGACKTCFSTQILPASVPWKSSTPLSPIVIWTICFSGRHWLSKTLFHSQKTHASGRQKSNQKTKKKQKKRQKNNSGDQNRCRFWTPPFIICIIQGPKKGAAWRAQNRARKWAQFFQKKKWTRFWKNEPKR